MTSQPRLRNRTIQDLSGHVFGKLTVLNRADDYITPKGVRHVQFRCVCECGKERVVRASNLRNGHTTSCGCARRESMTGVNLDDLSGRQFNRWTVLHRAESIVEPSGSKATVWHCRCDCGGERDIRAGTLHSGLSKSCGCLKTEVLRKKRDLAGQVVGRWTVLSPADDTFTKAGRRMYQWLCQCECGTVKAVSEQSLVRGKTQSCGCYRKERHRDSAVYKDLSGDTFGAWTVLERVPDRFYQGGGRATMWRCRCKCGNENIVAGNMLKAGISSSCGCEYQKKSEKFIRHFLDANGYRYEMQKRFDDLRGVGGGYLSYDYLVFDGDSDDALCLIEYQGEQHFKPVDYFGGEERFKIQQTHDSLKRDYAKNNNIPLIELDYKLITQDAIDTALAVHLNSLI